MAYISNQNFQREYAGSWWGRTDIQPVIALHGWLDNAASFTPLVSLLPDSLSVLSLDLPGHGLSSHYPPGCMYHFTEDIVTLRRILKHFNWDKVTIMGHSLGSTYAFLYAAIFPSQVKNIIGFDILRPYSLDTLRFVRSGGNEIDHFLALLQSTLQPPEYELSELIERQFKASFQSISRESCKVLLSRGSVISAEKNNDDKLLRLTRDIRLKHFAFLHCLPHEFLIELASRITCDVLNIKGRQGMYYEKKEYYEETLNTIRVSSPRVEYHEVEGTHHLHLNNPENVVDIVVNFLNCSRRRKWWGPKNIQPVLALHGWQDNAATFDPLMSFLPANLSVLALDLPGHGRSSHYPPGCLYHFTEDLVSLRRVVRHFNWRNLSIMGHSMGGSYSFLYAALFPTEVEKLVCFDIVRPFCLRNDDFVSTGGTYIDRFLNLVQIREDVIPPEYTADEIVERQFRASAESISNESSRVLLTRGAYKSKTNENLVGLTRDIRLKYCIFYHSWQHEFLLELASRVRCKVLNIKARPGAYFEKPEYYEETLNVLRASAKSVEYYEVPGTHHAHLNNPEYVFQHVASFLCSNNS